MLNKAQKSREHAIHMSLQSRKEIMIIIITDSSHMAQNLFAEQKLSALLHTMVFCRTKTQYQCTEFLFCNKMHIMHLT